MVFTQYIILVSEMSCLVWRWWEDKVLYRELCPLESLALMGAWVKISLFIHL